MSLAEGRGGEGRGGEGRGGEERRGANHRRVCNVLVVARVNEMYEPSLETLVHSGAGKVYCPCRILFFMPGEIGAPPVL